MILASLKLQVPNETGRSRDRVWGHLFLRPVTHLLKLQLALQAEQAVCCPGQLPDQCVIGLLHVLQLLPKEGVYLGKAHAPKWTKPTASCVVTPQRGTENPGALNPGV